MSVIAIIVLSEKQKTRGLKGEGGKEMIGNAKEDTRNES